MAERSTWLALAVLGVSLESTVLGSSWDTASSWSNFSICKPIATDQREGYILSPEFSAYENYNCTVKIESRNPNDVVTIHFDHLVIQRSSLDQNSTACGGLLEPTSVAPCCLGGMLRISELRPTKAARSQQGTLVQQNMYCGKAVRLPQPFLSNGNGVSIQFVSLSNLIPDKNISRAFKLSFYISSKSKCPLDSDFKCQNDGKCIPKFWRCNGYKECSDNSDEKDCAQPSRHGRPRIFSIPEVPHFLATASHCGDKTHILCGPHSKQCFTTDQRCDGVRNCQNGFDEMDCPARSQALATYLLCEKSPGNATRCGNGNYCYYQETQRCDGILHCPMGEDEKYCDNCGDLIKCGRNATGNTCGFRENQRCNGRDDCQNGIDELNCLSSSCGPQWGTFLCPEGRCISEERRCDHVPDCQGAEDELYCIKNSVITAAIMGSLVCGILVVIAISCTCRLYALRLVSYQRQQNCGIGPQEERRSRSSITDSDLLRFDALQDLYCYYGFRDPPPPYSVAVAGDTPTIPPPPGVSGRRRRSRNHHNRVYTRRSSTNAPGAVPGEPTAEQLQRQQLPTEGAEAAVSVAEQNLTQVIVDHVSATVNDNHASSRTVLDECSQRDVREHLNKTDSGSVESSSTGEIEFSVLPSSSNSTGGMIAIGTTTPSTDQQPLINE